MRDFSLHSGERVPHFDTAVIPGDHLARYEYVISRMQAQLGKAPGASLMGADIFCGAGYGAAAMARRLDAYVMAIDGSAEAIAKANELYVQSNLLFSHKLFPFELPNACFDFIASMESLEHVKDFEALIYVFAKALKVGGKLFLSCPSQEKVALERTGYPWHYKHFFPEEIRSLVGKYGLDELHAFSTSCLISENGDVTCIYHHQMHSNELKQVNAGDTLFFEFQKAR